MKFDIPCDCQQPRNYYRYYDTPDGCDIDKKLVVTTRYGVIAGLVLGTYDVLMYSHAVGLGQILKRYARHVLPLGMMGATFVLVSNGSLISRQIDDRWNYFFGGLACGPLLALYLRNKHGIVAGGLTLGVSAVIKKMSVQHDVTLFPTTPDHFNSINGWRNDWTLANDPKDSLIHTCGKIKPCE